MTLLYCEARSPVVIYKVRVLICATHPHTRRQASARSAIRLSEVNPELNTKDLIANLGNRLFLMTLLYCEALSR